MKHIKATTCERPVLAEKGDSDNLVCGYLFNPNLTKCVPANSPVARLLKSVPVE